jgi:hypothetical protein
MIPKRIFTYEDAVALLPEVQRRTASAVEIVEALLPEDADEADDLPAATTAQYQEVVAQWAEGLIGMGLEVKGLWLVDFDNGSGYYCWKWPEPALQYFHGYDEGFAGRVKLN